MNWIHNTNLETVKWLNANYDNKKIPTWLWVAKPTVFAMVIKRVSLIAIKVFIWVFRRVFIRKTDSAPIVDESHSNIVPEQLPNKAGQRKTRSLIDFLLYRQPQEISFSHTFIIRDLLTEREILKQTLSFPISDSPIKVSIIIPVYNKLPYTFNCLKSLEALIPSSIRYEVIVVDDNSSDGTSKILSKIASGIVVEKNTTNLGFVKSCNKGASIAKGEFVCFLNNDTEIQEGWLENLLSPYKSTANVGLVGSMLVYPNGQLQEAGGIIWNDASGWNYGRQGNIYAPEFNYLRPVDYCSGASILLLKKTFEEAGCLDEHFVPAYYEDTDLCFTLRNKLNLKVIYQPKSILIHHEGITSGTSTASGTKRYQDINAVKFKEKWANYLSMHLANGAENVLQASRRHSGVKTILIIDVYVTKYDKESGSNRLLHIVKIFKTLGYHVIFVPDNGFAEEPYAGMLQEMGVELLYTRADYSLSLQQQIIERLAIIDYAWICRPELNEKYQKIINIRQEIKVIYDTVDIHYLRLKRESELFPENVELQKEWKEIQKLEIEMAQKSDVVITVTETDKNILEELDVKHVDVIPNIHVPYNDSEVSFEKRKGLLFIGGYSHKPNVDAVIWLCKSIMPLIWEKDPTITLTLLGSHPSKEVLALKSDRVFIPGFIEDVSPYFLEHRVFVSPLRYGAGMKGKIGQSLEFSLPVVSTSIGVEGMDMEDGLNVLIADEEKEFADKVYKLYSDEKLWNKLSAESHKVIYKFSPEYVKGEIERIIASL